MNNNMDNGAHFLEHPAVRTAWARIDVGNERQATINRPGTFLITPELDFSLVSVHTLARLGLFGYHKFKPTSNHIGYIVSPSGRDVLAIGFVRLEVQLRVQVNVHSVALFNDLVCFIIYQEPPVPADLLFSMGRCSLLCCYGWNMNQIVPHNPSLPLHVPLPSQQQQQQQEQQQEQQQQQPQQLQHRNGNITINTSININANSDRDIDTPPTPAASASASNNHGWASGWAYIYAEPGNGTSSS
ncbi:hypothetical protein B0H65DRAFT_427869 [Neurospora tetraspora]|uniref:Uncharacterized protein n=1 Tax=Neurospora tetraspora TaxID=94610 RepID=A0AAE0JCY4_9PEZI|nr:hypothetical protein B0H65DRAFT_427869 [Neurospora tetraspora]